MRHIIFNGYSSEDKGLTMSGSTPISQPAPKISGTEIELADGYIDTSRIDGKLHYKTRGIGYAFTYVLDAYNQYDLAKDPLQMNKEAIEVEHTIREWIFQETDKKLYDTAYGDPNSTDQFKGYYFVNAHPQEFKMTKAMGQDKWVLQFQVAFACDPYMYEIGADPKEYVMFAGPTEGASENYARVRIYNRWLTYQTLSDFPSTPEKGEYDRWYIAADTNKTYKWDGTNMQYVEVTNKPSRMLWCNDNSQWVACQELTRYESDVSRLKVNLTFKPAASGLYSGPIGFYINHYVQFSLNSVSYEYHIDESTIDILSGNVTFVDSTRLVTNKEFGYTDQNGFVMTFDVVSTNGLSMQQLSNSNHNQIPVAVVWGTAKIFETAITETYVINGVTKGDQTFQMVTGTDGQGGIYTVTIDFGDPFQLDTDPYNELRMDSNTFGFFVLANEDALKRRL